jgi:DNA polymerase sigma
LNRWGISIKIFGSCATGLALANSDIDLAVDPSILNYFYAVFGSNKEKVSMALCSIMKILENRPWISNIKLITTASVPVLKFVPIF